MAKVGDIIRYLNNVGGGRIVRIEGNMAYVDDEGFETPVLLRECVVVDTSPAMPNDRENKKTTSQHSISPHAPENAENNEIDITEIQGGDKINITVGFEPVDRNRLSQTDFEASLINDSNYFLYFTLASRRSAIKDWTCRYAGMVEPNTELWLGTFNQTDVSLLERLCLQFIAFKKGKEYEMKNSASIEIDVDTTKFFKLHCYAKNKYFDNEVIAFNFVENDFPNNIKTLDFSNLQSRFSNNREDKKDLHKSNKSLKHKKHNESYTNEPLVVDLHINSLLETTAGMSTADILNYQVETFNRIMDENLANFGRKIIFIHGKGEGILRHALYKELNNRYNGHDVQDASFREYGYGATQVIIRQHPHKSKPR